MSDEAPAAWTVDVAAAGTMIVHATLFDITHLASLVISYSAVSLVTFCGYSSLNKDVITKAATTTMLPNCLECLAE